MNGTRRASPEPLYLVCGLMSDETVWKPQIEAFSARRDVHVLNFPDFDSIPDMAASAMDRLPERFSLAGHSMGGRVALDIYRRAGDRVRRLALLDTGIYPAHDKEYSFRKQLVDVAYHEGMAGVAREWVPSIIHPDRMRDETLVAQLTEMAKRSTPESLERQIKALLTRPDMRNVLPQIRCPVLVCCGRQDSWVSPGQHEEMAAMIEDARLAIIEHCGHMTTMESSAEINRLMSDWLQLGGTT